MLVTGNLKPIVQVSIGLSVKEDVGFEGCEPHRHVRSEVWGL